MRIFFQSGAIAVLGAAFLLAGGPGFRSPHLLEEHYSKYGKAFGRISQEQYLHMAQELRDAHPTKTTLEAKRADGSGAKFDRKRGWFVSYDPDRTLRMFFMPNDGIRYFQRQGTLPKAPK